jgi:hypothetical protein
MAFLNQVLLALYMEGELLLLANRRLHSGSLTTRSHTPFSNGTEFDKMILTRNVILIVFLILIHRPITNFVIAERQVCTVG